MLVDVNGEVQAETVSGDVAIRLDGPTGLVVKTVSGDAIVEGSRVDRFAFTTTSGDLRITSELGAGPHTIATVSGDAIVTTRNGIRVSAQTVAGDLSSDLPHSSEGRAGRRSLIVGEGTTVVQFRSVSGDLRVVGPNDGNHLVAPDAAGPARRPDAARAAGPAARGRLRRGEARSGARGHQCRNRGGQRRNRGGQRGDRGDRRGPGRGRPPRDPPRARARRDRRRRGHEAPRRAGRSVRCLIRSTRSCASWPRAG